MNPDARFERQDSSARSERWVSKRSILLMAAVALFLVSAVWFWTRSTKTAPDDRPAVQTEEAAVVETAPSMEPEPSSVLSTTADEASESDRNPGPLVVSEPLVVIRPTSPEPRDAPRRDVQNVSGLAFSPDGKQLAWWTDGSAWLAPLQDSDLGPVEASLGAVGGVTALAWDTEGSRWLTGDELGRLRIWGLLEGGDGSDPTPEFEMRLTGLEQPVSQVDWSGQLMACAAGGKIWLWQGDGRRLVATWSAHEKEIASLLFRRDGKALLSADEDGGLKLWNAAGRLLGDFSDPSLGSLQIAGFDPFGFVVAWARHDATESGSGDGPGGLWREAGGWWFPPEPTDRAAGVAIAGDGSYLLWKSDEAFLLKLRDEQVQPLSGVEVGLSPVLSPGARRLAWIDKVDGDDDGSSVAGRVLVAPLLPDPVGLREAEPKSSAPRHGINSEATFALPPCGGGPEQVQGSPARGKTCVASGFSPWRGSVRGVSHKPQRLSSQKARDPAAR